MAKKKDDPAPPVILAETDKYGEGLITIGPVQIRLTAEQRTQLLRQLGSYVHDRRYSGVTGDDAQWYLMGQRISVAGKKLEAIMLEFEETMDNSKDIPFQKLEQIARRWIGKEEKADVDVVDAVTGGEGRQDSAGGAAGG